MNFTPNFVGKLRSPSRAKFASFGVNNKQLLDEVEHDIMNYQNRGLCYLPKPKAQTRGFDNS